VYSVINKSAELFNLSPSEAEALANSAGLSLEFEGGDLIEHLGYSGKKVDLCKKAIVSDRMLRLYRHKTPTKSTLIALAVSLDKSFDEVNALLRKYGYCLSDSIIGDIVVKWYLTEYTGVVDERLLFTINETLFKMELPLLMTKQK
jgi:hypothetical protein